MPPGGDLYSGASGSDAARRVDRSVVTLRQLPPELLGDPELIRRLRAETPIVAHLDGTYVVRTRAYVEDAFGMALITDHVEGGWLRQLIAGGAGIGADAALVVVRDLLLGLEVAHREGILHRDLRPEKIVVDRRGVARIAELGVVARTPSGRWIPGTPEYLAPEIWMGGEPTIATDVYAAAVVLDESLTGLPPYQGGAVTLREQHLGAPLPGPGLPAALVPLVRRGMAKSPLQRYPRAWEFATAVQAAGAQLGGPHWERVGRRRLAALVASALAPAGTQQGAETSRGLIGRARLRRRART